MTRKTKFIFLFIIMNIFFGTALSQAEKVEGYHLENTLFTPYLIRRLLPDKNMLYASSFQVAWNKFSDEVARQTISLTGNPIMMQMLNRRSTGSQDLSEDSYLAMAGTKEDEVSERVLQHLSDKFNETPGISLELKNPHDVLLFSFLVKDIKFAEELERLEKPIMFNGSSPVKGFGIKEFVLDESHIRAAEQVEVIYYNSNDDFVIRLRSNNQNDEIFLAKIPPLKTLAATVNYIATQVNINRPQGLKEKDTLQIPVIDFDIIDWFLDLEGRCLEARGMEDYCVGKAVQGIKFKLSQNAQPYELLPSVSEEKLMTRPRKFIFDKPFLLVVKQQGASYPYFVLWVQNAEILKEAR